jgi:hypothetical protein
MTKPRFDLHERVQTPRQGIGRIVTVWPNKGSKPSYGVAVDGRNTAVIFDEAELRSAPPLIEGATVYCRDCSHGRISHFAPGSRRCAIHHRVKAAHSPRVCPDYSAKVTP